MTSSQRFKGYPASLIIYTHISWLPPTKSWFLSSSWRLPSPANSPPHKRISAKSNMKVTALVFLPGTSRSKWLWLKVCVPSKPEILSIDDIEDIENIQILETSISGVNAFDPPPETSHNWCLDKAKGQQNHSHAAQPNKPWREPAGWNMQGWILSPFKGSNTWRNVPAFAAKSLNHTLKKHCKLHPHQDHGGFIIPDRGTVMATRHRCCRSQFTAVDVAVQYFQQISDSNVLYEKLFQKVEKKKKHRARRTCKWLGSTLGVTLAFNAIPPMRCSTIIR